MRRRPLAAAWSLFAASSLVVTATAHTAPYLGERPPGDTPRVFAPGVVSTGDLHSRLAIAPDGREMFWSVVDTTTWTTRLIGTREVGGRWTRPEPPPFARGVVAQSPMFAPDGRRLYYKVRDGERWATVCVERLASGWSAPRRDGVMLDCSASFTRDGRAVLSSRLASKAWGSGMFEGRLTPAGIVDAAPLDSTLNVPGGIDYTPFVTADGACLLFSSNRPRRDDTEDMHVFASFRLADGSWSAPRRVLELAARFPSLSPDGRYLFVCGDDGNIHWVDARVLAALRPAR